MNAIKLIINIEKYKQRMKDIFVKLLATTTTSAAILSTGPDLSAI